VPLFASSQKIPAAAQDQNERLKAASSKGRWGIEAQQYCRRILVPNDEIQFNTVAAIVPPLQSFD
jgi:hypothetical protein